MLGNRTMLANNQSVDAFIGAFMNAGATETQDTLKPFWMDAMRIGNRKREIDTLSAARASFVPAPVRQQLALAWTNTQALTRTWSTTPLPAATGIPGAINTMTGLLDTVNVISRDYFGRPYATTLRTDNRIVVGSQLAVHIMQGVTNNTTRDDFIALIDDQVDNWTIPRLRVWFTAMGVNAVANGRIRLQQLPVVATQKVHLTNYVANVDATASIQDPIATVMDALFPPAVNWQGAHVTMELFGEIDANNPHYFKGQGWRSNPTANGALGGLPGGINAARDGMRDELANALAGYQNLVQAFMTERLNCLV
jgi:hypothetical protein